MKSTGISKQEAEWRAESDMRVLAQAEEIKKDAKRLAAAKACATEKLAELKAVAGTTKEALA